MVPRGTGTPGARNEAALPKWMSATTSIFRRGQYSAFCGQQQQRFAGDDDFARAHGCAAFSSSRTMRATRSDSFSVVTFSRKRSTISAKPNGVARLTSR